MMLRWNRRKPFPLAAGLLALLALLCLSCVKVKPSAYQKALEAYYQRLLSETSEASLQRAIDDLNIHLHKHPADAGMLMLRASAHLELIRLRLQRPSKTFSNEHAEALLHDLRLVQTLLDQPANHPLWLAPRIYTMAGDLMLLRSLAIQSAAGAENIFNNILRMELYRLAGEFFLYAASAATQAESEVKGNKDLEAAHLSSIIKEKANATDGYTNAIGGMAQAEDFLRLNERAQSHLLEASGLLSNPASFPQAAKSSLTPKSLYSYPYTLLAQLARGLESNPLTSFEDQVRFAELALTEDIAAAMLSDPVRSISSSSLPDVESVAAYMSSLTLRVADLEIVGRGDVLQEKISFTLMPHPLYGTQNIRPEVPHLTLTVGDENLIVHLAEPAGPGQPAKFSLSPKGISITVYTKSGSLILDSNERVEYFLNRREPFLQSGKQLIIRGPADNVIGSATVP